jgi:hypothetical protein
MSSATAISEGVALRPGISQQTGAVDVGAAVSNIDWSCPALCRASTSSLRLSKKKDVDGRDTPGHDVDESEPKTVGISASATGREPSMQAAQRARRALS